MTTINETATLDGANAFTLLGTNYTWSGGFIPSIFAQPTNGIDDFVVTLDLESVGWFIEALQLNGGSGNLDATINDATTVGDNETTFNAGIRSINLNGDSGDSFDVTLNNIFTESISSFGNANVTLTLGDQFFASVNLGPGDHTVTTGNGFVGRLRLGDGTHNVSIGSGGAELLSLGVGPHTITTTGFVGGIVAQTGNLTITTGDGTVENIRLQDGNHDVTIGAGGALLLGMGNGQQTITTGDGFVGLLFAGDGDHTLTTGSGEINRIVLGEGEHTLNFGSGRVRSLELNDGNHTVTQTSGDIDNIRFGNGNVTFNGGSGEIDFLDFGNGANTFVGGTGFVKNIEGQSGNDNFSLIGGANSIGLGSGTNTLDLQTGFYTQIISFSGNNTVTVSNAAEVRSMGLSGGVDIVTVDGAGSFVRQLTTGSLNDTVTVLNGGRINQVETSGDEDTITVSGADSRITVANTGGGHDAMTVEGVNARVEQAIMEGGDDTFVLGAGAIVRDINLGSGDNTFTDHSDTDQFVNSIIAFEGNDTINVNDGGVQSINVSDGINTISVGAGQVDQIQASGGVDTLDVASGRVGQADLGGGANVVTLGSGRIESLTTDDGNDTITIGAGRIDKIQSGNGDDMIETGDQFVQTVSTFDGMNSITAGSGGVGTISLGNDADTVTTSDGFVDFIGTNDGDDTVTIGSAGATFIDLGRGDDTLMATGFVTAIQTGDGADDVSLGTEGAWLVETGDGADEVSAAGFVGLIRTGDGDDTVTLSGAASVGPVSLGSGNDVADGNDSDNQLFGSDGNDTLNGGAGDDTLSGGAGADVFEISGMGGADLIEDFEDGVDLLDLTAFTRADALAALADIQPGSAILTFADGTEVTLMEVAPEDITADDVILAEGTDPAPGQIVIDPGDVSSYGGGQDQGDASVAADGSSITLDGNAWKQLAQSGTIDADTVVTFEFSSSVEGEVQGIGFENNGQLSAGRFFQLHGTDPFGIQDFNDLYTTGSGPLSYEIPVGQFFTGDYDRIVFLTDDDANDSANSTFADITLSPLPFLQIDPGDVSSYVPNQDKGTATIVDGGAGLRLESNAWKQIASSGTVTGDTIVRLGFAADVEGEVHGIGFENNGHLSADRFFQLHGVDSFGVQDYNGFYQTGEGVRDYTLAIGQYFTGAFDRIVFLMDDDAGLGGDSTFREIGVETPAPDPLVIAPGDVSGYGGNQDKGTATLLPGGTGVALENNAWKQIATNVTVDEGTLVRFEYSSVEQGEVHGIGFETDGRISADRFFQLDGVDSFGIQDFNGAYGTGDPAQTYTIPVGQYFTGEIDRIVIMMDDDAGAGGTTTLQDIWFI